MLIFREFFKTQSHHKYTPKRTKLHHIFPKNSEELAYAPEHPSICVQLYNIIIST